MKNIPFFIPNIDENELSEIKSALEPNSESKIEKLEQKFEDTVPTTNAIATSSGTSALHLAMCSLDLKRGDKVICSVNSFPSTPEVVRHFDAETIFVDIDKDDFNIDLNKLESLLSRNRSKKLKAIIINHLAGQVSDLERLYKITKMYGIKVIEDASQSMGGTYKNKKIGATGSDLTIFSFNPYQLSHSISNAGVLVTNNQDLADRARLLRNHAIVANGYDRHGNLDYVYDVVDIGCKYDLSELNAAFALSQFEKLPKDIERRAKIAEYYNRELSNVEHITTPLRRREHLYTLYIIKVDKNRDDFAKKLKERGVSVGLHYIPVHRLSYYKNKYELKVNDFPNALNNYQQILSIPIYSKLSDSEVEYIANQVRDIAKNRV